VRIWFDLSNSPHINLFHGMIEQLQAAGHETVITCRPLANTVDLLKLHGLSFEVIGEHYGARFAHKLGGYPVRVWQLYQWLKNKSIDVAMSQSSFHSPVTGALLGVHTIYMNDNEFALGNVPSFLFADRILVPQCLSDRKLRRQLAGRRKVLKYPGVKEGLYLWRLAEEIRKSAAAREGRNRSSVYVRPEPWTAQYYHGKLNFLDGVLVDLREFADVTILPRGATQGMHYRQERFAGIRVIDTALGLREIAVDCDLFIGAGGTMTREMAVLGIPTISVYQDELLDVDRYLLEQGAFVYQPSLDTHFVREFLDRACRRPPSPVLLEKGREAYDMVVNEITTGSPTK
jgi:predicted glycosyltransferase